MFYTARELDTIYRNETDYLNKLLALGEKLNKLYMEFNGGGNIADEKYMCDYAIFEYKRKQIEEEAHGVYKEYTNALATDLKAKGMSDAEAIDLWSHIEKYMPATSLHAKVEVYVDVVGGKGRN